MTRSFVNGSDIVARLPPWVLGFVHTDGMEASLPDENDPRFVRLVDRIQAGQTSPTPMMVGERMQAWTRGDVGDLDDVDVIDGLARAYVWGNRYVYVLTQAITLLLAPVALFAVYVWLLVAVMRAAAAHPNAGYHRQFFRPTFAFPALPIPARSRAARLKALALMAPLIIAGLWLSWPLAVFTWRFAFWVPQTIYQLALGLNS
ncbi:MAG: hypothetical protein R2712_24655 [Vicinamibacterales bacterium]